MRFRLFAIACCAALIGGGTVPAQTGDPTSFTDILNAARMARGLAPVAYDPGMVPAAAENNRLQLAYGLGHHFTAGLGQVAAVGQSDAQAAMSAWAGSPGHAALLFAPDLVAVGYHRWGTCHTAATRQGCMAAVPMVGTVMQAPAAIEQPTRWVYPSGTTWRNRRGWGWRRRW